VIRHLADGAVDQTGSERRLRSALPWQGVHSRPTMDEAPIAAAPAKRLLPALVLAVGLMLLWLVAYWYLGPLSWNLPSPRLAGRKRADP
jgi:hypothetical protein